MAELPRIPLYDRLPAFYRTQDAAQDPPFPLRQLLAPLEHAFGAVGADIEGLYHDFFVETCAEWVLPYLGDLLGVVPLSAVPNDGWALRADLAQTVAIRRRKGTLGALEAVARNVTGWMAHAAELRRQLVMTQHPNHLRPGRGGTLRLREPGELALLGTPFDESARFPDLRPPRAASPGDELRYNLANVALFLWRREVYTVTASRPVSAGRVAGATGAAPHVARFIIDPLGREVRLHDFEPAAPTVDTLSQVDAVPGPIITARLSESPEVAACYVAVTPYRAGDAIVVHNRGTELHVPDTTMGKTTIRGGDLCAWEKGIHPPIATGDVVVDPVLGRLAFGVASAPQADDLLTGLRVTYSYGFPGPIGAHPRSREGATTLVTPGALVDALKLAATATTTPLEIVLAGGVHDLDLGGFDVEGDGPTVVVARPLTIRAADHQRPILQLAQPLRFRAGDPAAPPAITLVGLFITGAGPLIARAEVDSLVLDECTLDPGGSASFATRTAAIRALRLGAVPSTLQAVPEIVVRRSITGSLAIDPGYQLSLSDSIVDAVAVDGLAVTGAGDAETSWGPPTRIDRVTVLGRARLERASGQGGLFTGELRVRNDQIGCLRLCRFAGPADRLPQQAYCVGPAAHLVLESVTFGNPGYARLAPGCDLRIRERGPDDDAMGAWGLLAEAHHLRNLSLRLRELLPTGLAPVVILVT